MARKKSNFGLFFGEFLRTYHTTGAIAPSGRFLAAALARYVDPAVPGKRVLEVGPGTGAVTGRIIKGLSPDDRFDLVELNDRFVERLRHRFESEPAYRAVADQARVLHCPVEDLPAEKNYDVIVSGLPLNNFSVEGVERILGAFRRPAQAGRNHLVLRVHCHPQGPFAGEQPRRTDAAPRHRQGLGRVARPPRNPPRLDLAQRPARLGASRAAVMLCSTGFQPVIDGSATGHCVPPACTSLPRWLCNYTSAKMSATRHENPGTTSSPVRSSFSVSVRMSFAAR